MSCLTFIEGSERADGLWGKGGGEGGLVIGVDSLEASVGWRPRRGRELSGWS